MAAWCCLVLGAELQPAVASAIDFLIFFFQISAHYTLENASSIKANQANDAGEWWAGTEGSGGENGDSSIIWQIKVVCKVLEGGDVITIAATGSGKSLTYWLVLLYIKHGIVVLVTPLIWSIVEDGIGLEMTQIACRPFIHIIYVAYSYLHVSDTTMDVLRSVRTHPQANVFSRVLRHSQTCTHCHSKFWQSL